MSKWRYSGWLIGALALVLALVAPALGFHSGVTIGGSHGVAAGTPAAPVPVGPQCPANSAQCNGGHLVPFGGALVGGLLGVGLSAVVVLFRRQGHRRRRVLALLADGFASLLLRPPRTFLAVA